MLVDCDTNFLKVQGSRSFLLPEHIKMIILRLFFGIFSMEIIVSYDLTKITSLRQHSDLIMNVTESHLQA